MAHLNPLFILIDNGHGHNTPGKCSPDGRLQEWDFTRRLARRIHRLLEQTGIESVLLVPEDADVPLGERVRRVNDKVRSRPDRRTMLFSVHVNASGSGRWSEACGWSVFVSRHASGPSQALARALTAQALARGLLGNRATPPEGFWRADFAMLTRTLCPAVLTENMMMDNRGDLDFLLAPRTVDVLADLHLQALKEML